MFPGCRNKQNEIKHGGIISTAPNITQMIYTLGLEDQLSAVSRYCTLPQSAPPLPAIGGYFEINYELLLSIQPELVILLKGNNEIITRIESMGFKAISIGDNSLDAIFRALQKIGKERNIASHAAEVIKKMRKTISDISTGYPETVPKPRVLLTFGRDPSAKRIHSLYAIGTESIHHEILVIAGGENAYTGKLPSAEISAEGILRINPDIIIDMLPGSSDYSGLSAWEGLSEVNAVKNRRIATLTNDYVCIPGPNIIRTLKDFSKIIHSETHNTTAEQ